MSKTFQEGFFTFIFGLIVGGISLELAREGSILAILFCVPLCGIMVVGGFFLMIIGLTVNN